MTSSVNDTIANRGVQKRMDEFFQAEGSPTTEDWVNQENEVNTAVGREAAKGKYIKPFDEMTKKEKLLTAISEALFE